MRFSCPRWLLAAPVLLWVAACSATGVEHSDARILAAYPHDRSAVTQGLLIDNGILYESTGRYGQSTLRRVELESGRVLASHALAPQLFAEGLALAQGRLYQLTWKAGRAFVYDAHTLNPVAEFHYAGEGWGLTWDGRHLVMSDGSASLRFIDPNDFSVVRRVQVRENGAPVSRLNELEAVGDEIWANVWFQDRILRIDPHSGRVLGAVDASDLRAALPADSVSERDVLNGIAWDAEAKRLYVTGKNWPRLFEIAAPGAGP